MSARKERLTVTVDRALLESVHEAVEAGRAESISALVSRALAEHFEKERRLAAMADAIAAYEAEFGTISDAEIAAQQRADRASAVVVRGQSATTDDRTRRSGTA